MLKHVDDILEAALSKNKKQTSHINSILVPICGNVEWPPCCSIITLRGIAHIFFPICMSHAIFENTCCLSPGACNMGKVRIKRKTAWSVSRSRYTRYNRSGRFHIGVATWSRFFFPDIQVQDASQETGKLAQAGASYFGMGVFYTNFIQYNDSRNYHCPVTLGLLLLMLVFLVAVLYCVYCMFPATIQGGHSCKALQASGTSRSR